MKSLTEQPAVLSVHSGAAGQYILRVADLKYRPLVIGVSKLLPDATSLVVITPSDIKVFAVGGEQVQDIPEVEGEIDPETQAAIDFEEKRSLPGQAEETLEEVTTPSRTRKRAKPQSVAGHDEQCGRCKGIGKVQMLIEGGQAAETTCPICRGEGIMRRYGARR